MALAVAEDNLKAWHSPESRPDFIHDLIHGVDRYNPTNLPFMEDYLAAQVKKGQYDLFANLAILKLYQFNPHYSNPDVIINVLVKALASSVSRPDFNLCLEMLREPFSIVQDSESDDETFIILMPFLQQLHQLIQTCQFTAFWDEINGSSQTANILRERFLSQQVSPLDSFRRIFSISIASCFRRISVHQLSRWLNLQDGEVSDWCQKVEWTIEGQDVIIPQNGQNDVKASIVRESVSLNQLTKLISAAAY
ncbi:uncharacterized protein L203_103886 [Cryptococcus depauperatus CBS 7841]|uniref:Eukaryotic translation initiation factor 3 subunit K n=1 Tax=Cryptococcus depauperatus CBS 7841 TaxID=1295531 RepID=A0AAJ8JUH8_9TREE